MNLSVIIPTLNESSFVQRAIRSAWAIGAGEVIVADGGSTDDTVSRAESMAAKVIDSPRGRGVQLNRGASVAHGDWLSFLHADNAFSGHCGEQLRLASSAGNFFCFRQRVENRSWAFRWIERGNSWRVQLQKLPYGDQGLTVRRDLFDRVGGFDEIPLMEDVRFSQKLAAIARVRLLPGPLLVADRRWLSKGPLRQTFRNWWTMLRYRCGADPDDLYQSYYDRSL